MLGSRGENIIGFDIRFLRTKCCKLKENQSMGRQGCYFVQDFIAWRTENINLFHSIAMTV